MVMQPLLRGSFPMFSHFLDCLGCMPILLLKVGTSISTVFYLQKNTKRSTSVYPFLPHSHWLIPYNQDRLGETAVGPEKRTVAKFVAAQAP